VAVVVAYIKGQRQCLRGRTLRRTIALICAASGTY
jgi:hypothetical protein